MKLEQFKHTYRHLIDTGFTNTPNSIILDNKLSSGAKILYQLIKFHGFGKEVSFPSENLLAEEMNCKIRMVRNYKKELKKTDWLTWTYRNRHCYYFIQIPYRCKLSKKTEIVEKKNVREFGMSSIGDFLRHRKSNLIPTLS